MYGLPQAGIIAQELLEQRLLKAGYTQSKITSGYWKHEWRPISLTLVVDDFGVKLWECLTAGFKAFSFANVKGMGTND
jgi:hypothetical protein